MRVYRGFEGVGEIRNPVVTTGTFDGVHFGHKVIINRLKALALKQQGESVLITFHPHPRKVLYPETVGKGLNLINSQQEKITLLEEAGLDNLIIVEFTPGFADITSYQFVNDYLIGKLGAKVIVVGFNHFFGHNKEGDFSFLESLAAEHGFVTEEIPEQEVQNETVSSTEIRKAIRGGFIQRANAYLDHYYIVMGTASAKEVVLYGTKQFNIIRIVEEDKLLPAPGAYAITVNCSGSISRGMAIVPVCDISLNHMLIHLFDHCLTGDETPVRINFHRRMSQPLPDLDEKATNSFIYSVIEETNELIF